MILNEQFIQFFGWQSCLLCSCLITGRCGCNRLGTPDQVTCQGKKKERKMNYCCHSVLHGQMNCDYVHFTHISVTLVVCYNFMAPTTSPVQEQDSYEHAPPCTKDIFFDLLHNSLSEWLWPTDAHKSTLVVCPVHHRQVGSDQSFVDTSCHSSPGFFGTGQDMRHRKPKGKEGGSKVIFGIGYPGHSKPSARVYRITWFS